MGMDCAIHFWSNCGVVGPATRNDAFARHSSHCHDCHGSPVTTHLILVQPYVYIISRIPAFTLRLKLLHLLHNNMNIYTYIYEYHMNIYISLSLSPSLVLRMFCSLTNRGFCPLGLSVPSARTSGVIQACKARRRKWPSSPSPADAVHTRRYGILLYHIVLIMPYIITFHITS